MNEITLSNTNMANALELAKELAKSNLVPNSLRGKPHDIAVVLQTGKEIGLPPATSLRSIDIISGTPAIKPQAMLALIRQRFPNAFIKFDEKDGEVTCTMARDRSRMDEAYSSTWNTAKAKRMNLMRNEYLKQLNTMLRWRALGECCRIVFPDISAGLYSPEEHQNSIPKQESAHARLVEEAENLAISIDNGHVRAIDHLNAKFKTGHTELAEYDESQLSYACSLMRNIKMKESKPKEAEVITEEKTERPKQEKPTFRLED